MEAPIIKIPDTEQNRRSIHHPKIDSKSMILIVEQFYIPVFSLSL